MRLIAAGVARRLRFSERQWETRLRQLRRYATMTSVVITPIAGCVTSLDSDADRFEPFASVPDSTGSRAIPFGAWVIDDAFQAADAAEWGPFAACQTSLPRIEEGLVEFDTAICAGYSVRTLLGEAIPAGAVIEIVASHTLLLASDPARGRMVVRLDGAELDRWEAAIPGPADARTTRWLVNEDIPAGTSFGVHVSNHGANNWRIVGLKVYPDP